jgi:hypothetical protein
MKTKLELINHCLKQTEHITPYTFEHYVLMELLARISDKEFEEICENYKQDILNE